MVSPSVLFAMEVLTALVILDAELVRSLKSLSVVKATATFWPAPLKPHPKMAVLLLHRDCLSNYFQID